MIRLRPFKPHELDSLLSWMGDERAFAMWSAGQFTYPMTKDQLQTYWETYLKDEHAWIFAALNEKGELAGHLLMRLADYEQQSVHLGFIILNPNMRGKGHGKEMIQAAIQYAFAVLKVSRVTLGVFENNPSAHRCYLNAGLKDDNYKADAFQFFGETWGLYEMSVNQFTKI